MSLGRLAHGESSKRKADNLVDMTESDIQAALELIQSLRAKKAKALAEEDPLTKAFREFKIENTQSRQEIVKYLHLDGTRPIFSMNICVIIAAYHGTVNVHDSMVSVMFRKRIWAQANDVSEWKGKLYPKGVLVDRRLSDLISFHAASYIGCSAYDGLQYRDGMNANNSHCRDVPVHFCHRAGLAFCFRHSEIDKSLLLPDHIHFKGACNACWIVCPCKNTHTSDIPRNGNLKLQSVCAMCRVNICHDCRINECANDPCPYRLLADTFSRGLCVHCKPYGSRFCGGCRLAETRYKDLRNDSDRDSDGDRVNSDGEKIDSDEEDA